MLLFAYCRYETAELVAFLQQIVTYRGFYDANLDFVGLRNVHLVASMNPSTTVGRYPLSKRFTANVAPPRTANKSHGASWVPTSS